MFELHYNISCQIALNVVCVVHVCTIHSLVLYRVLCEVLWMALNVLVSECWWLVWCVIHLLNGHILSITVCPEVSTGTNPGHGMWQPVMKGASLV